MDTRTLITRTCSNCGIEKPLSAFLQVSGAHGTIYGNICSSCRGINVKEKKAASSIDEEGSTMPTGLRIGSKEKLFADKEQIRQIKTIKDLQIEQSKKRSEVIKEKAHTNDVKIQIDKDYRKAYLEAKKKQGFLSKTTPPIQPSQENKQPAEKITPNRPEANAPIEMNKRDKVELNMSQSQPGFGENKVQSEAFKSFLLWLGADAPAIKFFGNLLNKNVPVSQKTTTEPAQTKFALSSAKPVAGEKKALDPIIESANRNWGGPSSRRG